MNFLRLSSRIDAVASRLETAIRMQQVSAAMGQTVKGMTNVMKSMEVDKIANTMDNFERLFEDMDVRSGYMESTVAFLFAVINYRYKSLPHNVPIDGVVNIYDYSSRSSRRSHTSEK